MEDEEEILSLREQIENAVYGLEARAVFVTNEKAAGKPEWWIKACEAQRDRARKHLWALLNEAGIK